MLLRVNDMFRKYACYKIPNKNMWEFFLLKKKIRFGICDIQVEIIVVFIL